MKPYSEIHIVYCLTSTLKSSMSDILMARICLPIWAQHPAVICWYCGLMAFVDTGAPSVSSSVGIAD